ncbi:MAG: hypothetical protein HC794_01060 [Nitrospiraceae bacterium]|nr:hypothetical protein [Nitrospiraceae bacterium]
MSRTFAGLSLKTVLRFDGALCLLMGIALIALRNMISGPTGLSAAFLTWAGILLLPVGLFILVVAAATPPARFGVGLIVVGNALWVLASLVAVGLIGPTGLGTAFVLVQAVGVAIIADVELLLNRSSAPTSA